MSSPSIIWTQWTDSLTLNLSVNCDKMTVRRVKSIEWSVVLCDLDNDCTTYETLLFHRGTWLIHFIRSVRNKVFLFQGQKKSQIITKQIRYVGIDSTEDGRRIFAISSDPMIRVFFDSTVEQQWKIENDFLPCQIILSKSEQSVFVTMKRGFIRIYSLPFIDDGFIDVNAHSTSIRQVFLSSNEKFLFSLAESNSLLVFRDFLNQKPTKNFPFVLISEAEYNELERKTKQLRDQIE